MCIDIYPLDEWQKFEEKLLKLNSFDPVEAKFIRMISQFATDDTMDSQSRILIPHSLIRCKKLKFGIQNFTKNIRTRQVKRTSK